MIAEGFLPILVGFMISGALVAVSDFKRRKVNDLMWLPALVGLLTVYSPLGLAALVKIGPFVAGTAVAGTLASVVSEGKFGSGDAVAMSVLAFWPSLLLLAVVPSFVFAFAGIKMSWWGGYGVPLAGIMGLMTMVSMVILGASWV